MTTEGIMQETLDRLKQRREELQPIVDEYEVNEQLIGDVEEMVVIITEPAVVAPKKAPAKKKAAPKKAPNIPLATIAPPGVTRLDDKRKSKAHSEAGKKGGRPTKKATFLKLLKSVKEVDRAEIPALIDTTVARVNEFVPELVREGLAKIDDKGDNHGPEFVVITEQGMSA